MTLKKVASIKKSAKKDINKLARTVKRAQIEAQIQTITLLIFKLPIILHWEYRYQEALSQAVAVKKLTGYIDQSEFIDGYLDYYGISHLPHDTISRILTYFAVVSFHFLQGAGVSLPLSYINDTLNLDYGITRSLSAAVISHTTSLIKNGRSQLFVEKLLEMALDYFYYSFIDHSASRQYPIIME